MLLLFPPTFKTRDFCVAWSLNVNGFCLSVQSRQDEISQKNGNLLDVLNGQGDRECAQRDRRSIAFSLQI